MAGEPVAGSVRLADDCPGAAEGSREPDCAREDPDRDRRRDRRDEDQEPVRQDEDLLREDEDPGSVPDGP